MTGGQCSCMKDDTQSTTQCVQQVGRRMQLVFIEYISIDLFLLSSLQKKYTSQKRFTIL